MDQWCNLLEADEDTAYPGHWLGFYTNGEKDPTFILRCNNDFTPICLQRYDIILPIPVQCSTVGTHSRCLRTWERPFGEFQGFFYMIKIIHTNRGAKEGRGTRRYHLLLRQKDLSRVGPDRWRWKDNGRFLNYTTKEGQEFITNSNSGSTRAEDKWQGYLPGHYKFY